MRQCVWVVPKLCSFLVEISGPSTTSINEKDCDDQLGFEEQEGAYGTSIKNLNRFRKGRKNKKKNENPAKETEAKSRGEKTQSVYAVIYGLIHLFPIVLLFPAFWKWS